LNPFLIIALLTFCMASFAQSTITTDTSYSEPGHILTITFKTDGLRDSTVYSRYKEGGKAVFIFRGNGSAGTWLLYDKEGYRSVKYDVDNNQKNGPCIYYNRNGKIKQEEFFKDNLHEGKANAYFENGNLKWQGNYKKNKVNGESIHYYANGKLQWTGLYKDGKMSGPRLCYTEFGSLCSGLFVIRDEKGLTEREGLCKEGKPEGKMKQYHNGELTRVINFKDGKPDGFTYYYKGGKIILTEVYKNGKFKKEFKGEVKN
jgi:antitoxin component YwqK of YwqJK toxin-antitoxin module